MEGEVGSLLRAARLKKGAVVDVVVQHTRIPRKFIEALEANRFEDFPAMVYLQSYLKEYSDYLEMDFEGLWKRISPAALEPGSAKGGIPSSGSPGSPLPGGTAPASARDGPDAAGSVGWFVLAFLLAAAGGGIWLASRRGAPAPVPGSESSSVPPALAPIYGSTETVVGVQFGKAAYLRLSVDGEVRFEGIAPQGTRQEWRARRSVILRTPNPQDISLTLGGGATDFPMAGPAGDYAFEFR